MYVSPPRQISNMEASTGCVVLGATADNEAVGHAALRNVLDDPMFRDWIIIRCTCHIIMLLVASICSACPPLEKCVDKCHKLAKYAKNHKEVRRQLDQMQRAKGIKRPLMPIICNNTRKWYASYLEAARTLILLPYYTLIMTDPVEAAMLPTQAVSPAQPR